MMDSTKIRLGRTDSVSSVNVTESVDVEMRQTGKVVPWHSMIDEVDAYDVYSKERSECETYRMCVTVKPYCTNALFNACTEVTWMEGSDKCKSVLDNKKYDIKSLDTSAKGFYGLSGTPYGKVANLERYDMVRNTEYSSESIGFDYNPGVDIFDNHWLRTQAFRSVTMPTENVTSQKDNFNTVADIMRRVDGSVITFSPRITSPSMSSNTAEVEKHLYDSATLLSFENGLSISNGLTIENGWYGFRNVASIDSEDSSSSRMNVNRVINRLTPDEFVDMYPGRDRYAFAPYYNAYRNRYERNWEIMLTYPYENFYGHNLVTNKLYKSGETWVSADGETNALLIYEARVVIGSGGSWRVLFRTHTKHGLSVNSEVTFFFSGDGNTFTSTSAPYRVANVGDLDGNNSEYMFYVTDMELVDEIIGSDILSCFYNQLYGTPTEYTMLGCAPTTIPQDEWDDVIRFYTYDEIQSEPSVTWDFTNTYAELPEQVDANSPYYIRVGNSTDGYTYYNKDAGRYFQRKEGSVYDLVNSYLSSMEFRMSRNVRGQLSEYYIRKFRKVPNRKLSKEPLTYEISADRESYERYEASNTMDSSGVMYPFDSEDYNLAFSRTVYGDEVAQKLFVDDVDMSNLLDNRGRPVSEVYATVVRTNKGYKEWYGDNNYSSSDVERSHCFGKVTTGFEFLTLDSDDSQDERDLRGFLSCAAVINNVHDYYTGYPESRTVEEWEGDTDGISPDDTWFYGDIVEYNVYDNKEVVLSDACFRFNTAQREICDAKGAVGQTDYQFLYEELVSDDYDSNGFQVSRWSIVNDSKESAGSDNCSDCVVVRPEGYYYKAHYRIPVREYSGSVTQGCHYPVRVESATPVQSASISISVTAQDRHKLNVGDGLYIADASTGAMYTSQVTDVVDAYTFLMSPIDKGVTARTGYTYYNWVETCERINSGEFSVRKVNTDIPSYADRVGDNIYLWRDIVANTDETSESEVAYPYANGRLYAECDINFYLKRQDPEGINGLYFYGIPTVYEVPDIPGKIRPTSNYSYTSYGEELC